FTFSLFEVKSYVHHGLPCLKGLKNNATWKLLHLTHHITYHLFYFKLHSINFLGTLSYKLVILFIFKENVCHNNICFVVNDIHLNQLLFHEGDNHPSSMGQTLPVYMRVSHLDTKPDIYSSAHLRMLSGKSFEIENMEYFTGTTSYIK
ncbi:hypothetical protein ACJX0J_019294, partial [Zea mays]